MEDWKDKLEKNMKSHFVFGIIAAILMVIVGIVMCVNPAASLRALVWLIIIAFLVAGIFRIVSYTRMPYWIRQGFTLVIGIIDILCAIALCFSAVSAPLATDEIFAIFIGLMFAFDMLFAGVNTLASVGVVKRMGGGTGWLIASGILLIISSMLLFMVPISGTVFLMYALAFAFIVGGISLFASTIDLKNRSKSFEEYMENNASTFDPENDPFVRWKMH